jgi:hypothetical protein
MGAPMLSSQWAGRLVVMTTPRELHSRTNDGIYVQLLWSAREDRVFVSVYDSKKIETLSVDVRDGARALDVFHHPFAYVA